jgi:hypothetical protein
MSDGVKQFASTILQAAPIWRSEMIHDLADRITDPRPPEKAPPPDQPAARAKAIFDAAESAKAFDNSELGFAFEEDEAGQASPRTPQSLRETNPSRQLPRPKTAQSKKILGMTTKQLALLAAMVIIQFCILIGFGAIYYFTQ